MNTTFRNFKLFTYFTNPWIGFIMRTQTEGVVEETKYVIEEIKESIPTPKKNRCLEEAKKLIPNYVLVIPYYDVGWGPSHLYSQWKNGEDITLARKGISRMGVNKGEDTNLYYPYYSFTYSKRIISSDGIVLGIRGFIFTPTRRCKFPPDCFWIVIVADC